MSCHLLFLLNNSEGYIFFPWVIDSDDVMVCLIANKEVIILDVTQHTPVAPSSIDGSEFMYWVFTIWALFSKRYSGGRLQKKFLIKIE